MFDILIKDILPIFVIMALGYAAGKRGVFTSANAQIFNKLVLTYALPAALFVSIVKANRTMLFDDGKLLIISLVFILRLLRILCVDFVNSRLTAESKGKHKNKNQCYYN